MVDKDFSFDKIESILNGTSNFYISSKEELNKCLDHVVQLISDSYVLYINNSYTSSSFLAISVLEEVGKIQMGIFIKGSDSYVRKDKLRNHKSKQIVGASYTICMGERIKNAISNENLEKTDDEDGDLIYLDRIQDEEEEKQQKKLKKTNRIERFIKKIDDKVNPIIKFQTAKSYGTWYLIKTDDNSEKNLKNVRYDFLQEENGYRIIKSYFDPQTDKWNEEMQRGWIEEKKGNVYLDIEKKYFKNNRNEIVFFDKNYRYMIIRYYNGVTRVLSRYPNNNKISLENDELDEFEKIVDNKSNLKNLDYDVNMKSIRELENERKKAELKNRTDDLERRLSENPASVFQIDTIGAKREFERRMRKEGMTRFETKDGTKSVEVIELNDEDLKNKNLKNKNKIENNGKDTKK